MKKQYSQIGLTLALLLTCAWPTFGQTGKDLPTLSDTEGELKGGETHSFKIRLNAGQFLYAFAEQEDYDLITAVFGPDGKQVSEGDSPNGGWGPEPIIVLASMPGEYRVEVRSGNKTRSGKYRIKIVALREATAIDKTHVAAQSAFEEGRRLFKKQNAAATREALEKLEQALPLFKNAGDTYRQALTALAIGNALYASNDYRKALEYFNDALSLAVAIGDGRLESGVQTYVGGMYDILGDVGKALDHQQRAVELAREQGWRTAEASALSNIGKLYNDGADWQKALEFYTQALVIFKAIDSKPNQSITLNNIGIAYFQAGEPQKALDYLQQSLPLLRDDNKYKNSEAYTLLNIGRVYRRMGENKQALDYFNQAQAIQKETGNRAHEGETLDELGLAYSAEGQHEKALEYHRQAAEIQRSVGNLRREAVALTNLGEAYNRLEQPDKAIEPLTQSLSILRNIGDLGNAAVALQGIARAEQKQGNLADAGKHIAESVSLIETVRARSGSLQLRASYRATMERVYELYIDVLMQQHAKNPTRGFDAEALRVSERGRARSLVEKLSEAPIDIRQGIDAALLEKERDLKRVMNAKAQRELQLKSRKGNPEELATLGKELSALEDEYQQVQAAIRKSSPQYSALTQPQPLGLKEIQQQLDRDTLLLEYALGEKRSYLWVVTPDSLKTFELPKAQQIEKIAREALQSLAARSVVQSVESPAQRRARIAGADAMFEKAATELSRMILAPASAEFGTKRLVIVADGALQSVPFPALPLAANRPVILDHEIVSLQSASAFAVQRHNLANRTLAPRAVAVIADPVFSVADARFKGGAAEAPADGPTRRIEHLPGTGNGQLSIPRLPFTRSEADQILAVAPSNSSMKVLDFRANRSIATGDELSKYRYVHFATHGYVDTTRSGLSAIVLSLIDEQGNPQDGFLRTHDIYNLKLPAELVVLSACETGLGKAVTGEGLEGLTRGFMYAGARRVVVSLWNVNDKATASLMQHLYVGMLKSNKSPAAALRAAQIEMLRTRQWQSPYFWAAFVMQGEWR